MKKRTKSSFKGKVQRDAERQRSAASSYGYLNLPRGVNVFSADPGGRVKLDFMPYKVTDPNHPDRNEELEIAVPGTLWYKRPFRVHRNVGAGDGDTEVCLSSTGKKCPICEYRTKRLKEGADKDETDDLKSSLRVLYVVIPIDHKKLESKPHIFDISQWCFQKMLNEELEEDEDNGVFPDLEEGKTLRIRWASKTIGKSKPFAEASRIDFEERDEVYDESILDDIPDLDKVLKVLSYEALQAKFMEMDDGDAAGEKDAWDDDDGDDDEPEPVKKPNFTRKKKKVVEQDDDEDDDEDTGDDDGDDDRDDNLPKPVRNKRKPKPKPEPEPDDDDEDDDDEPDEPEPVKKSNSRKGKQVSKSSAKNKCPFGHKFGVDANKFSDCDECEIWDECDEENEKR